MDDTKIENAGKEKVVYQPEDVQAIGKRILNLRNQQVLLDRDLAELYCVETKVLNQAVKRNIGRFPSDFRFQLTDSETKELVTICDRFELLKHSSVLPYAFTEQGVAMLSTVLKSDIAVKVSIGIMRAFVEMRHLMQNNSHILQRLTHIEQNQIALKFESDCKFAQIFERLEQTALPPKQGVFFQGQIFDAYQFVADLIRSAKKSILLIDNYVDDSVLKLLLKRKENVLTTIIVNQISSGLKLDIQRHNAQYPSIEVKEVAGIHDRFLLLDETELYTFGASFKDLGKKLFCFSKIECSEVVEVVRNL